MNSIFTSEQNEESENDQDNSPVKYECYVNDVVHKFDDKTFQTHFQLTRTQFELLRKHLHRHFTQTRHITFEKALLSSLWALCTPDCYREIAERFKISKGRFTGIFHSINKLICEYMQHMIYWPCDQNLTDTVNGFKELGFPGTLGALDATYIKIDKPFNKDIPNPNIYHNGEYFSITLLATCNAKLQFTYVYVGGPSSWDNADVLYFCNLGKTIAEEPHVLFKSEDHHIIAGSDYPLFVNLMTPYTGNRNLNDSQNIYNKNIDKARNVGQWAFELLKLKFKRLQCLSMQSIEGCVKAIHAATILYNLSLKDEEKEYSYKDQIINLYEDSSSVEGTVGAKPSNAEEKRDTIANSFL